MGGVTGHQPSRTGGKGPGWLWCGLLLLVPLSAAVLGGAVATRVIPQETRDPSLVYPHPYLEEMLEQYRRGEATEVLRVPIAHFDGEIEVHIVDDMRGGMGGFASRSGRTGRVWLVHSGRYVIYDYGNHLWVALSKPWCMMLPVVSEDDEEPREE